MISTATMFVRFYSLEVGETVRVNSDEISPFLPFGLHIKRATISTCAGL